MYIRINCACKIISQISWIVEVIVNKNRVNRYCNNRLQALIQIACHNSLDYHGPILWLHVMIQNKWSELYIEMCLMNKDPAIDSRFFCMTYTYTKIVLPLPKLPTLGSDSKCLLKVWIQLQMTGGNLKCIRIFFRWLSIQTQTTEPF
jgi:hypothetical protein